MMYYRFLNKLFYQKKIIKVYSHPRSGTHFLEAFLAKNFYRNKDLSLTDVKWGHWSNRKINEEGNPYGQLFGHHFFPINSNFKAPGIYIIRDGRAVAYSIWKTHNFLHKDLDGKISFSEFLRLPLDWYGSPSKKTNMKFNILEHWERHCSDWLNFSYSNKKVLVVYYEDLKLNPYKVYTDIRDFNFRFKRKLEIENLDRITKPIGLLPNEGNNYAWNKYFHQEDYKLFKSILKNEILKKKYGNKF